MMTLLLVKVESAEWYSTPFRYRRAESESGSRPEDGRRLPATAGFVHATANVKKMMVRRDRGFTITR